MHFHFKPLAIAVTMAFQLSGCSGDGADCTDAAGDQVACVVSERDAGQSQLPEGDGGLELGEALGTNNEDNLDTGQALAPDTTGDSDGGSEPTSGSGNETDSGSGSSEPDTTGTDTTGSTPTGSGSDGGTGDSTTTPDQNTGSEPVGSGTTAPEPEPEPEPVPDTDGSGGSTEPTVPDEPPTYKGSGDYTDTGENGTISGDVALKSRASAGLTSTPDPSGPFSKFQLDDMLYTNNVYDGRQLDASNNWRLISYDGVQDYVKWRTPVTKDAYGDPCSQGQPLSSVYLDYRLTSKKDSVYERNTFVRSFPAMVVGTMGGRYESWGVECGNSTQLPVSGQRSGNSPVYDMTRVAQETGFPKLASDLDSSVLMSVKGDIRSGVAGNGIANIFVDTYWHNVSDVALVPGQDGSLVDTINGINSDVTETWNLNIWFDWPRHEGAVSSWTGGFKIGEVQFSNNANFDVYFKLEGARTGILPDCRLGGHDNCFLYIGLVTTDLDAGRVGTTLDYLEVSNWMKSADFRDLFLSGAYQTGTPNADAYTVWTMIDGEGNDSHPDPAARGPRFPDDKYVIGGLHMGSELWFNPDAEGAVIQFSTMGIHVEGVGTFGSFEDYR